MSKVAIPENMLIGSAMMRIPQHEKLPGKKAFLLKSETKSNNEYPNLKSCEKLVGLYKKLCGTIASI